MANPSIPSIDELNELLASTSKVIETLNEQLMIYKLAMSEVPNKEDLLNRAEVVIKKQGFASVIPSQGNG